MDYCTIAIVKVVLVTTLAKVKVVFFTNIAIVKVVNPSTNGNWFAIYLQYSWPSWLVFVWYVAFHVL